LSTREWKQRIIGVSDRERALNNRLMKMLISHGSPIKIEKFVTESCSHCSQRHLENTLRRYLYERSNISMTLGDHNLSEMAEELQKITEEIVGARLPVDNGSNPEDILNCVLRTLKEFHNGKKTERKEELGTMEMSS
jgi:hypothetical protein